MLTKLKGLVPQNKEMPGRAHRMTWLEQFRTGAIYDNLKHSFMEEKGGAGRNEYIVLADRRPAVRFGLPMIIVNDTVSLVFGEDHFPKIECTLRAEKQAAKTKKGKDAKLRPKGEELDAVMASVIKDCGLVELMQDAATKGSKGSVAIWFRVLKDRVFFDAMDTAYLTPSYDPEAPDTLVSVREQYAVKKKDLIAVGYKDLPLTVSDEAYYWFRRDWTVSAEVWFKPWLCQDDNKTGSTYDETPVIDTERGKTHSLGFVPIVWVRNLPGGDKIDGACTYEAALDNSIEIDYQLSQAGRGLKYSSDPTLYIRDPAYAEMSGSSMVKGGANAIVSSDQGDAKLLEINGSAAAAVVDYVRFLREISMELCGGNRASPERLSGAQSGRAMEMMNQGLIWLGGKLRTSYGEGGLASMLRMVLKAAETRALRIAGEQIAAGSLPKADEVTIGLKWPDWYAPTATDLQAKATGIKIYRDADVLSRRTGVAQIANEFDIEDVDEELERIDADLAADAEREAEAAASMQPPGALSPVPKAA